MKIDGVSYRTIWVDHSDNWSIRIIDQTRLPWALDIVSLRDLPAAAHAIRTMQVRGAPLIGVTAAYGLALALRHDASTPALEKAAETLAGTRPTAVNLRWAIDRMLTRLRNTPVAGRVQAAYAEAALIADEDVSQNETIGEHGQPLIADIAARRPGPVNVLTHCNAGWLATVDYGTALAPIYTAHDAGTNGPRVGGRDPPPQPGRRPHRVGAGASHGVPHTVHERQRGRPHDAARPGGPGAIVGADRITSQPATPPTRSAPTSRPSPPATTRCRSGSPTPSSTIDWSVARTACADIPIEERDATPRSPPSPAAAMDGQRRHRPRRPHRQPRRQPGLRRDALPASSPASSPSEAVARRPPPPFARSFRTAPFRRPVQQHPLEPPLEPLGKPCDC